MAKKPKQDRAAKKEVKRLFDKSFDTYRLNYKARIKPVKPKAILYGVVTAGVIYTLAYAGGYYGFVNNIVPMEGFAKLVWIMMIPSTVIGLLVYAISKNRMEYPIRQDIRDYMTELEIGDGLLWKFFPLWEQYDGSTGATKKALAWSQEKRVEKLDIEDYTEAVANLFHILDSNDLKSMSDTTAENIAKNFGKTEA